ncbi:MAG: ABC transporter permease [Oscillospiraceae bacterium]|jgi:ABC-type uncharacterized transport system permease subunit|nr:ABC transporter permease [Oscillospiraceae bacterium]MDE6997504.1 ABC transporter permease [Oscillospiraceae bacterium]
MRKKLNAAKCRPLLVSVLAILFGFVAGSLLLLASGADPLECYLYLFQGGVSTTTRIFNTLANAIPLIFTGLSITFAYKTGLFNIGATGQMMIAGLASVVTALSLNAPRAVLLPAVVLAGLLAGALWGGFQGFLRSRFNVNEVVSGIMMNWIAHWTVYYIVSDFFRSATMVTESRTIPDAASLRAAWLCGLTGSSSFNYGFFLALAAVAAVHFILRYTVTGYHMKAVGFSPEAAEYGGIHIKKNTIQAMAIAGALAGLAGVSYYCGYSASIRIGVQPSQGFDGIAVALLGNLSPAGVVFAAVFFAVLQTGKGYMNAMVHVAPEIADTILAIIIYFAAISKLVDLYFNRIAVWLRSRKRRTNAGKGAGQE